MPVVLSRISYALPDGRALFQNLDLAFGRERAGLVGRNGVGKSTLLRLITGDLAPQSGAIAVEGRAALLRQSLLVREGESIADLFCVRDARALLARAGRGEASAEDLARADWTLDARLGEALARMGLDADADTPLSVLSGGQRTRAALAALIFAEPDILLLDEPTNNLDREGRAAVIDLLAGWRAGAIVVSHDRELLERMDAIVELTSLGAQRFGGNWSAYRTRKRHELAAAAHDLADAEKRVETLARTAQLTAERKARKDGAGKRRAAKGDAPKLLLGRMKERAENSGADQSRVAEKRQAEASAAVDAARARIEVLQPFRVALPSTHLAAQKSVLRLAHVTAGHDPAAPVLCDFSFAVTGPERVAIAGANGAGKSTLLSVIAGDLQPCSGEVRVFTRLTLLDQRVRLLDPAGSIRENFLRLNAGASENACRAALAQFMFREDAALQRVGSLSGGQILRAGLACVLGHDPPPLLLLDEPTNHLDIEAIEAVEAGLRAYDGALLLVSHDEAFLDALGVTRRLTLGHSLAGN
jgi:ATPase subunit of ABC transporter with duplicated ATPase domains